MKRYACDIFRPVLTGYADVKGKADEAARFVEQEQLLDPALWALFTAQFRIGNVDDRDNGWRCEYWGKMMRGACYTYAYTQNEQLYQVMEATVRDMLTTQDADGRFSTYSVANEFHGWDIWGRKYVLLGMEYFLEFCRDASLREQILTAMERHADYLIERIGPEEAGKTPIYKTSNFWLGINASSIMEGFVKLYSITGKQRFLDFARYIIDCGAADGFDLFAAALEDKQDPYQYPVTKAYEMMSNFEGILETYRVTGERKYLTLVENFARRVLDSDITVIGSAGCTHELFDHSRVHQFDPAYNGIMQETCVTVTWMKLCFRLLCLTGDSRYADAMEQSGYNALLGAVNFRKNERSDKVNTEGKPYVPQVFTFDSYSPLLNAYRGRGVGGYKDLLRNRFWWGCCVAIGACGTGMLPLTAMLEADDGVAVNFYLPGTYRIGGLQWKVATEYPVDSRIRITVEGEKHAALRLRIPAWSQKTTLTLNGEVIAVQPGAYAVVERDWKNGDAMELTLDLRTRIVRAADLAPEADSISVKYFALQRGCLTLARDSAFDGEIMTPVSPVDCGGYAEVTGKDGAFSVKTEDGSFTAVPYFECGQDWDAEKPITVWMPLKA